MWDEEPNYHVYYTYALEEHEQALALRPSPFNGSKLLSKARDSVVMPCKKQIHHGSSADFSSWLTVYCIFFLSTVPANVQEDRENKFGMFNSEKARSRLLVSRHEGTRKRNEQQIITAKAEVQHKRARGGSAANNCRRGLGKVRVTGPRLCLDNQGNLR
ncbi:hypothetical protein NC653_000719 [Populus alba x Populus x berolinensis]|uniref:Uncharacterized protein n=1 Tax=Populus alba x Populus x berolinensis TaxID=444605 RepID=A0AAD6RKD6_9ROSI|nr:hypothetical protein NC653_000719 [Populus alba x Populus x berolinensis]